MFEFFKKIMAVFSGDHPSSLMEKAMDSVLLDSDQIGNAASSLLSDSMKFHGHDDLEEMMLQQQIQDMHDPYKNPGLDLVIDEHYHGIDHGMDHHDFHHHDF